MAVLKVRDHGPIVVELGEGESLELLDGKGTPFGLGGRRILSLCRCGHSNNKPLCDGSHRSQGFVSEVLAQDLVPPKPAGS